MFYIREAIDYSDHYQRPYNHDRCFYMNYSGAPDRTDGISILAVLDGVSQANGDKAATMAASAMRPVLASLLGKSSVYVDLDTETRQEEIFQVLREAILAADQTLRQNQYAGIVYGTTVTLVVACCDRVYAANVGDSPAYLFPIGEDGRVFQPIALFQCQNEAGDAVRRGEMTPEEALDSKRKNHLTGMVGGDLLMDQDIYTTSTWLRPSSLLMLGSDGALAVTTEEEMRRIVENNIQEGVGEVAQAILKRVENSTSTDNFTILCQWLMCELYEEESRYEKVRNDGERQRSYRTDDGSPGVGGREVLSI